MDDIIKKQIEDFFMYREDKRLQTMMIAGYSCDLQLETTQYIQNIVSIPVEAIVEYIVSLKREPINAADVFQFSDFDDATTNLCSMIKCDSNRGLNYLDTGKLLLGDKIQRKDGAYRKYGENHIKMASSIGLAFKINDVFYLSPLGCAYDELDVKTTDKLLLRLLLRNKLISQLLSEASKKSFDMEAFLYDLSKSTYIRRKTNIKYVISIINKSTEYDFLPITQNIIY